MGQGEKNTPCEAEVGPFHPPPGEPLAWGKKSGSRTQAKKAGEWDDKGKGGTNNAPGGPPPWENPGRSCERNKGQLRTTFYTLRGFSDLRGQGVLPTSFWRFFGSHKKNGIPSLIEFGLTETDDIQLAAGHPPPPPPPSPRGGASLGLEKSPSGR